MGHRRTGLPVLVLVSAVWLQLSRVGWGFAPGCTPGCTRIPPMSSTAKATASRHPTTPRHSTTTLYPTTAASSLSWTSQSQTSQSHSGNTPSTRSSSRTAAGRLASHTTPRTTRTSSPSSTSSTLLHSECAHHHHPDPLNNRHSASDWLYNVRSLPQSRVLREIRNPVLAVASWTLLVSVVHRVCSSCAVRPLQIAARHMTIPGTAHSFLVSALGLLLVFRTNSAYQRFNEGRKIWENVLSVSRNLSRMIHLYGNEVGDARVKRITNLVAAYPYLLRQHIRPGCLCSDNAIPEQHRLLLAEHRHYSAETRHDGQENGLFKTLDIDCWVDKRQLPWSLFLPSSLPHIAVAENRPLWVCDRMARLVVDIPYGPNFTSRERLALIGMVDKLTNAVGQCERIHQTAVPLNYARHSLRSLTLWLFTLPFALVKDLGLFAAPANACIAWLFFGVYQIGYSIEDPFQGSLRLSILCDAIRRNVLGQSADMRDSAYRLDKQEQSDRVTIQKHSDIPVFTETPLLLDKELLSPPKLIQASGSQKNKTLKDFGI